MTQMPETLTRPPMAGHPIAADPGIGSVVQPSAGVGFLLTDPNSRTRDHDIASKMAVAVALAELLDLPFHGVLDPAAPPPGRVLVVPTETLEGADAAARLGIRSEHDLFGGVVPAAFVASKVITHPLVSADAEAPPAWSAAFCDAVAEVVLPGHAAFTRDDARLAGERLLAAGAVRLKEAGGVGGTGQYVVRDTAELEARLQSLDVAALGRDGVVLERNLDDVTTLSVGQVRVGPWLASYCGTQGTTPNHQGDEVYGGSELTVVLGDYDRLLTLDLPPATRTAIEQARVYDAAARACYPGLMASRCNYDIAQGLDAAGQWRSGVLEQSWRIGGASGAEIAALQAFKAHPGWRWVRASTHEHYADQVTLPPGARLLYDGVDPHVGRLVKYAQVQAHGDL